MRAALTAMLWALIGLAVVLAIVTSFPGLIGMRSFTVLSGSMEPSLKTGSVILVESLRPGAARPGDVVTFPDPSSRERLITHRLRGMTVRGGKAFMVTRGDANRTAEKWNVPLGDEIGRVRFHLPLLGYPRAWLTGLAGRLLVLAIILAWGLLAISEIWRTRGDEGVETIPLEPSLKAGAP